MVDSELKDLLSATGSEDVRPLFLSVERSLQEIRQDIREMRNDQRDRSVHEEHRIAGLEARIASLEAFRIRGMTVLALVSAGVGPAIWIWAAHH